MTIASVLALGLAVSAASHDACTEHMTHEEVSRKDSITRRHLYSTPLPPRFASSGALQSVRGVQRVNNPHRCPDGAPSPPSPPHVSVQEKPVCFVVKKERGEGRMETK